MSFILLSAIALVLLSQQASKAVNKCDFVTTVAASATLMMAMLAIFI